MVKRQEKDFFRMVRERGEKAVRDVIAESGINYKRCWRYLENRGWYEYGVTLDLGWLTETAPESLD